MGGAFPDGSHPGVPTQERQDAPHGPRARSAAVSLLFFPKQAPQTLSALSLGGLAPACVPRSAGQSELETSRELGRVSSPRLCLQDSRGPAPAVEFSVRMVWVCRVPLASRRTSVQAG